MKNFLSVFMAIIMILTMASCGVEGNEESEKPEIDFSGDFEISFDSEISEEPEIPTKPELPEGTEIFSGETYSSENHEFSIKSVEFKKEIKEKNGNISYSRDFYGKTALCITLDFKNLGTEELDDWSDRLGEIKLLYNENYIYEGNWDILNGDIVPLDRKNLYISIIVPESFKESTAPAAVAFSIDEINYLLNFRNGEVEEIKPVAENIGETITVGDTRENEGYRFTVKDVRFIGEMSEKYGNVTYSTGEGKFHFMILLDFTNLGTEELDDWSSRLGEGKLVYDGKYNYEGTWNIFVNDIVPLDNGNLYLYFEIPETIKNESGSITATFSIDGDEYTLIGR